MARPMPDDEPVMMATLSRRRPPLGATEVVMMDVVSGDQVACYNMARVSFFFFFFFFLTEIMRVWNDGHVVRSHPNAPKERRILPERKEGSILPGRQTTCS